ncbi:hypothetical protein F511_09505 [Dorcoceras hygrometricum]|uniref:Uncharacterized protein n=1 Tax=Dorcoceras hygrometricum TaxID=472368 RepID=A0A2Z7AVT0_9LAMI|nr:hypothetical protein F511_09505 [Dorcoceras hygrometricum]
MTPMTSSSLLPHQLTVKLTEATGSPNLPKQLTIQLNTKPNLLSTYDQGSRLLNKALLALTKLQWEESLTQKIKSEKHGLEYAKLLEVQLLRSSSTSRSTTPNWYPSKEIRKTNTAPPVSLQTTVEIDDNLTEKG